MYKQKTPKELYSTQESTLSILIVSYNKVFARKTMIFLAVKKSAHSPL